MKLRRELFCSVLLSISLPACDEPSEFASAELLETGEFSVDYSDESEKGAVYQAGSVAKYACTILALRYVDEGLLELNEPIVSYLPNLQLDEAGVTTVADVLANRSGLRDGLTPAVETDMASVLSLRSAETALVEFSSGELSFSPGSEYSYDLVNWIAAQAILERVGGQPIDELLAREALEPAGMNQSFVFEKSLGQEAQTPATEPLPMPDFLKCAGGIAAVPQDLVLLLRFAHKRGLSTRSVQALKAIRTPEENYSLGGRFENRAGRLID